MWRPKTCRCRSGGSLSGRRDRRSSTSARSRGHGGPRLPIAMTVTGAAHEGARPRPGRRSADLPRVPSSATSTCIIRIRRRRQRITAGMRRQSGWTFQGALHDPIAVGHGRPAGRGVDDGGPGDWRGSPSGADRSPRLDWPGWGRQVRCQGPVRDRGGGARRHRAPGGQSRGCSKSHTKRITA
jgi:hypothetical protein